MGNQINRNRNNMSETDYIPGKYQMTSSVNFDGFLERLGVGLITRKLANQSYPGVTWKKEGEQYTMTAESLVTTSVLKFKLGEQIEELTGDGRKVLTTMTQTAPNTVRHEMLGTDGGKDSFCVREFMADKMKCVCQVEDVVTTRMYERNAVEAMHGWTLLLEPNSPRRKYLTDWEEKVNGLE